MKCLATGKETMNKWNKIPLAKEVIAKAKVERDKQNSKLRKEGMFIKKRVSLKDVLIQKYSAIKDYYSVGCEYYDSHGKTKYAFKIKHKIMGR